MFFLNKNEDGSFSHLDIKSNGRWRDRFLHRFYNAQSPVPAGLRRAIRKALRKEFPNGPELVRRTLKKV